SLLSEQIRRSPPVDPNRTPLLPAGMTPMQLRRSSAPIPFPDPPIGNMPPPAAERRPLRRAGGAAATISGGGRPNTDERGPPPLLEGTESVRLNLLHER